MKTNVALPQVLLLGLAVWLPTLASAAPPSGQTLTLDEVTQGSLLLKSDQPGIYTIAPTQRTEVDIRVTGPIIRAEITQLFDNPTAAWAEAIYAFPLPEQAAVDRLAMKVGDRVIEGVIEEKSRARKTYEAAKQQGKRSALIEQHRPNLFTSSVANIPPHGSIEVRIEYQDLVTWKDGRFSLRYPMAITPRYRPPETASVLDETIDIDGGWAILPGEIPNSVPLQRSASAEKDPLNPVRMQVWLNPGLALNSIVSPSHAIVQSQTDPDIRQVRFAAGVVAADRDFILEWQPVAGDEPRAAFFSEHSQAGNYALMMIMPPSPATQPAAINREVVFVIDTSGSMGGESMRQARTALISAIEQLNDQDHFNVLQFNAYTEVLFSRSLPANAANRRGATRYVAKLEANGGTEIRDALVKAFEVSPPSDDRMTQVVFITDGAVNNEAELLAYIDQHIGERRLFTVGIGSAPNTHFMAEAASFGRGTHTYIPHFDTVNERMRTLFDKLARPALTDIQLQVPATADILPDPLPDLYTGEPLIAAMRVPEGIDDIDISGRIGSMRWNTRVTPTADNDASTVDGLGIYWARQKIQNWMRRLSRGHDADRVRQDVTELALNHHLVSQYTSLVAVDVTPVRPPAEPVDRHALDSNLPAGWKPSQPVRTQVTPAGLVLAQGATGSWLAILTGLLLLATAAVVAYLRSRVTAP